MTETDIIIEEIRKLLGNTANLDGSENDILGSFLARESENQYRMSDKKMKITHFNRYHKKPLPIQLQIAEAMQNVFGTDKKVVK